MIIPENDQISWIRIDQIIGQYLIYLIQSLTPIFVIAPHGFRYSVL